MSLNHKPQARKPQRLQLRQLAQSLGYRDEWWILKAHWGLSSTLTDDEVEAAVGDEESVLFTIEAAKAMVELRRREQRAKPSGKSSRSMPLL